MKKYTVLQLPYAAALCVAAALTGCVAPPPYYQVVRGPTVYMSPVPKAPVAYSSPVAVPVISAYIDPPLIQPEPIAVSWAPPAMLVEVPPLAPFPMAVWTGGYWDWHDRWIWSAGRWMAPPQFGYGWVQPYYEHRDNAVLFISGYWSAPGLRFVPPPPGISIAFAAVAVGVVAGPAPIGPQGVFVPPPPGSRPGLIVPAPIGTPPAVVMSAPPVTNIGMRIRNTTINNNITNNVTNNVTNTTNITNITNVRNFTVTAPAAATGSGKPFEAAVPAAAHLAAALPAVMRLEAPAPVSMKPVAAFVAGRAPVTLPTAQLVRPAPAPAPAPALVSVAPSAPVPPVMSAPSAVSLQHPETVHRQAATVLALSPEAAQLSRVNEARVEAAKQANIQRALQPGAGQFSRPAPADRSMPSGVFVHAQSPSVRLVNHVPTPERRAAQPSPAGHSREPSKPKHEKK